ncbi:phosphoenolpyruvate--protein phosphotransferase [[Clostridium] symbiosum]|uniref:phosphoenolpyruvate--protein phosphotransferase n=1 Tax=Clostridium symbiosum TaxID=1512 RepID=UPI001D064219|nr:phosphoenolpyruvate--protein phosphotransferase [[Clostridium] symbiosum]MCB6608029.1 phosphoenolpyruvate--protein phosphotransferase [[Clostridium] symbiosum]MCB6931328.1 phosphoenolpyruvate--protein phosphotransferase [[Clostridium] symbiosum]
MEIRTGKAVLNKSAIGKIWLYRKKGPDIEKQCIGDTALELARFEKAQKKAADYLYSLHEKALKEIGEEEAAIFEAHLMMMEDDDFAGEIKKLITAEGVNAEYAVSHVSSLLQREFEEMEGDYMRARALDIRDISERLILALGDGEWEIEFPEDQRIVISEDLSPSETLRMDKNKILGFIIKNGSLNSHTAILARTMGVPALMGVEISEDWNGRLAAIDGEKGLVCIDPEPEQAAAIRRQISREEEEKILLKEYRGKETVTQDGKKIRLYTNIAGEGDMDSACKSDAEGIGLFRSEFLYLQNSDYPTEEEQFLSYKNVLERMGNREVIIRTMDIGADKKISYFGLPEEENPALGFRGIRICLERREIFKTQVRALLRAAPYGSLLVMYPMITSVREVREIRGIVEEVKKELSQQNQSYGKIKQGIMIETPAAVMISDELAREVDFFSIGTNDLTQYTLAVDRQNDKLDRFYDPYHPAVFKMIKIVCENAHKNGIWAGLCGELAADPAATEQLIAAGIDELSVAPSAVLALRKKIASISLA